MRRTHMLWAVLNRAGGALRAWRDQDRGSMALIVAVGAVVILGAAALAIDQGNIARARSELQKAADAAAIAAAKEMTVIGGRGRSAFAHSEHAQKAKSNTSPQLSAVAQAITDSQLLDWDRPAQAKAYIVNESTVRVEITHTATSLASAIFGGDPTPLRVVATAESAGSGRICVLALERSQKSLDINNSAQLTGNACGIFVNSGNRDAIDASGKSLISADVICTAGGAKGKSARFSPGVTQDCPRIDDPLERRPPPPVGGCDHRFYSKTLHSEYLNLSPGTYCGGLTVIGEGDLKLDPGVYVIKDGPLVFDGNIKVRGEDVGFYMTGPYSNVKFAGNADIDLSAPINGPMAGILMRTVDRFGDAEEVIITSNRVRRLLGTLYLYAADLIIDTNEPISSEAAFTIVIADRIMLSGSPNLVLNSDYDQTRVPVPKGLETPPTNFRLRR